MELKQRKIFQVPTITTLKYQRKAQKNESSHAPSHSHGHPGPGVNQFDINFNEDVPASAVELSVQEKLLKKIESPGKSSGGSEVSFEASLQQEAHQQRRL